jgi:hypothetical protein
VTERLGHENATLVLKTYGHLMPNSEDRSLAGRSTLRGPLTAYRQPRTMASRRIALSGGLSSCVAGVGFEPT